MSLFILDLGISVSLSFGLAGLYYGLGHFSVVEFWSIQVVFKKTSQIPSKPPFLGCVADVFDAIFCSLFSLFLGACCTWAMLALSQAHVEEKSSHVGLLLRPFQSMLGQCGATLVYVGTVLGHVVSSIGPMLC